MVPRTVLIMCLASLASQAQVVEPSTKAGVVREWQALLSTRDGVRANEYLKNKAQPDTQKLERMQSDMEHDRTRLAAKNRDKLRWLPWRTTGRKRLGRQIANESKEDSISKEGSVQRFETERHRSLGTSPGG